MIQCQLSRVKARREQLNLRSRSEVMWELGRSKVSSVSNGQPEPVSQADWHHFEWWKGSRVAGDKTITGRCGVYSGDCRQEVAPLAEEHSPDRDYAERAAARAAIISLSYHHSEAPMSSDSFGRCCVCCMSCISRVPSTRPKCLHCRIYLLCLLCSLAFVREIKVRFTAVRERLNACYFFGNGCVAI